MLRSAKKSVVFPPINDEAVLSEMAAQRNASAFFEKFDRSELQELLAVTSSSWLVSKDDTRVPLHISSGLTAQLKNVSGSGITVLAPVEPDTLLDCREVHQILRELTVGIFCLNQIPSISLEANYDHSTSCQLPPAYYDTRVGQILINVDYMLKALWHGAYMPREKRLRFSEFWRASMDIDPNGIPQTKRNIFAEFCSAGLVDISKEANFDGMYDKDLNEDPTYEPNNPEEKHVFMQYADKMTIKMTCYTTQVQQLDNVFIFAGTYTLSNVIRLTDDLLDSVTYQRLQQRLTLHQRTVRESIERKAEIRKHIAYMKLISFLVPLLVALKKKMKVPALNRLLQPFSDDKVKTERELPPMMLGPDFTCQHFEYQQNEYFHLHGGIEFDIGTPSLEDVSEEIKAAYDEIQSTATSHIKQLLDIDTAYREYYPIPIMEFNERSYYVIAIEMENFYQSTQKGQWWGAINGSVNALKLKRLPLNDSQLHEQFKKRFGYKKAIKCKNVTYGLKSAAERGLSAIFHTFCRKTPASSLSITDESGSGLIHHAAMHNHVSIIAQLAKAGLNLNQRRSDGFIHQGKQSPQDNDKLMGKFGPTALHLAAQCGSLEVISCLLALKADYTLADKRGWMAIHFAAFYGNILSIRALFRREPALLEMETTAEYGATPLLLAATSGALEALCYLLSLGANWKKVDSLGNNIVHLAVLYFHSDILKYIIQLNFPELHVWNILVEMLKSGDPTREEMAARSLEVFCVIKDDYWKNVFEAGSIPSLVELLKSELVKLESLALGVLSNISKHQPVSRALVEAGAIPVLINLLFSPEPELQSRCSVILSDIAQVDNYQDVIAEMGGIAPLIGLLHSDLEDVLVNVINCIQALCKKNPANQKAITDQGGIPPLVEFLSSKSDVLLGTSSGALAELARGNKQIQDAIAREHAIDPLVKIISGRKLNIQVKAAMAIEALSDHNAAIQKQFLEKSAATHVSKLLKVFQLEVREQGSTALWALAGQTLRQQKFMAEHVGYNFIIDLLLSPSDKMQYVGGQAVIALSKDSKHHQDQICEGNGVAPLVRLLRSTKIAESTLLSVIRALGTMCVGVAHQNNPVSQEQITEENALPTLVHLLKTHPSLQIKVEVACTLACIVLGNTDQQSRLQQKEGFKYHDVLELLHTPDKDIRLRAGYALALFAYNNTLQQFLLLETGGIEISVYEPFLNSEIETDKARAAFQIVVLARVIVDMDQVTLTARGVTILVELLRSKNSATVVLAGELIASLAHTRAGIPDAITTLGTVECLTRHLYSEEEEVRVACANALGYLTFNRTAHRHLLVECRNKPTLFDLLISNLNIDAKISKEFTEEFKRQQQVGLPSLSLVINGGPPAVPVHLKGSEANSNGHHWSKGILRSKSAVVYSTRKHRTEDSTSFTRAAVSLLPPTPSIKEHVRPKTAHIGNTGLFCQKPKPK